MNFHRDKIYDGTIIVKPYDNIIYVTGRFPINVVQFNFRQRCPLRFRGKGESGRVLNNRPIFTKSDRTRYHTFSVVENAADT